MKVASCDEPTRIVDDLSIVLASSEVPTLAIHRLESAICDLVEPSAKDRRQDDDAEDETTTALPSPVPPTSVARQRTAPLEALPSATPSAPAPIAPRPSAALPITTRTQRGRSPTWPLLVWGLLAGVFAGLAVVISPLGDPRFVKRELDVGKHVFTALGVGVRAALAELGAGR